MFHRMMNSVMSLMVLGPVMWCTQALPWSASATEVCRLRFGTAANTAGAMCHTLDPRSQLSSQKSVDSLFPKTEIVAA